MAERSSKSAEPFKDYYQLLHLHPTADAAMVDQAYWHLARLYNQEGSASSDARHRLDGLNEAYSVLRSPQMREAYDQMRNELLGEGAMPIPPGPVPTAPPLTVMEKQRPKAREVETGQLEPAGSTFQLSGDLLTVLPWQSALGCAFITALAAAALISGVQPLLVIGLLVLGLALMMVPLVRKLPHLHAFPTPDFHMPAIRAPHLPDRPGAQASSLDPDTLRRSTEAIRQRWRQEIDPAPSPPSSGSQPPDDGETGAAS